MISAATGRSRGECLAVITTILVSLVVLGEAVANGRAVGTAGAVVAAIALLSVFHAQLLSWRFLLGLTLVAILFVPIRRYSLPARLPFHLELYRIVAAIVIISWLLSLLVDRRVRFRRSGLEKPFLCYVAAIILSLCVNTSRVNDVTSYTVKSLTFFLSFFVIFYVVVSVVRTAADIDRIVRVLVGGGAVVATLALFEATSHVNVFNHLSSVIPVLHYDPSLAEPIARGGGLRVFGSAQHPIAMGAAFAVLLPLAVYLARTTRQQRWWLAGVLMLMALFATRSRTGIVMLIALILVYLVLRPRETKRWWPALIPLLLLIHFALPGTLGSFRDAFFPQGGLLAQEHRNNVGSGRLATLGPALSSEFTPNPVLGEGSFTRVTVPDAQVAVPNAPILDDQWLGVLLETGLAGFLSLLWFFGRAIRRMGGAGRRDASARGWLLVGATASVTSYAVGMLTYDSFAFVQVTFLLFVVLAIGASAWLAKDGDWQALAAASGRETLAPREGLASA
jgi:polysaccharide biosynthesis protein PslJ